MKFLLTLLVTTFCYIVTVQADTITVIYQNKKTFRKCTYCEFCFISRDTMFIKHNCNAPSNGFYDTSRQYSNCHYFLFVTKKGRIIAEGEFNNESACGKYIEYYANGNVKIIGQYDFDGNRVGKWRFYNRNRTLRREEDVPQVVISGRKP